jgi:hypothetical protein
MNRSAIPFASGAGEHFVFTDVGDADGDRSLWLANEMREDVRVEQVRGRHGQRSICSAGKRSIGGKILVEGFQLRWEREKRRSRDRFYDQPTTFLSQNRFLAGQLQIARNP